MDNLIKHYALSSEQAEEIIDKSVRLARSAIDECRREESIGAEDEKVQCFVAGSIGPYGAILADGSEFNGWYADSMTIEVDRRTSSSNATSWWPSFSN